LAVINKEGSLTISDGSSTYTFRKDGSFISGPRGICGRTIDGKWRSSDSGLFVVEGTWGWDNGLSEINDVRIMTLSIQSLYKTHESGPDEYKCYLVIEELKRKS